MFFAGIGLLALPVDLINSFITRPKYISLDIYTKNRIALDNRLTELIEIGEKIFEECETAKTLPKSERKKAKGANSITINKYKQAVYFLEQDYEDLQICHYAIKNNTSNPLWYFLYLFLGILSIIISVLFLLQIILYIIPIQVVGAPLSVFLNGYFIWFDGFFPLFGTLSVAFFAMFLLACVMKGVFKFGMRFFLLPIHPMKPQDTYMNSFLFNLIFVLLCIIPTVQFCSQAFRDYARLTDIDVIFAGQVTYMDYFKYVYEYNVFIYGMLIVAMLTTLYLIICPGGGEKEKTHDQLRSLMLDERAAADKKAAREAERAAKYLKT
jgi:LMBR1 domain-containing protein 1